MFVWCANYRDACKDFRSVIAAIKIFKRVIKPLIELVVKIIEEIKEIILPATNRRYVTTVTQKTGQWDWRCSRRYVRRGKRFLGMTFAGVHSGSKGQLAARVSSPPFPRSGVRFPGVP
jgi:hypothetical protein